MYARCMTMREIQAFLEEQHGVEVSPELISTVTKLPAGGPSTQPARSIFSCAMSVAQAASGQASGLSTTVRCQPVRTGHGGQCPRQAFAARAAAWAGRARVRLTRVRLARQVDPGQGSRREGLHQPDGAQGQRHRSSRASDQPRQVACAGSGRACVCRRQAAVKLRQGTLPRPVEERYARICRDPPGQHLPGAQAPHGMSASARRSEDVRQRIEPWV
jgi:hypothetical protein